MSLSLSAEGGVVFSMKCKLGLHDWEYFKGGGNVSSEWRVCKLCKKSERHIQYSVVDKWEEHRLDDIDQHSICPFCLSRNVTYKPQFSDMYTVAGTCHCLDCGCSRSVV